MAENRYRKIEVRMWGDEKFRTLSPLPPSGQSLWLFLLTGPHTGPIPGLFRVGRAALAEELGWPQEDFDKAFDEDFRLGMVKADWKARVVWIPNAIKCNPPQSPNVIISWASELHLVPECGLKAEAYRTIESTIYGLGDGFRNAFAKTIRKPSVKSLLNQEQEQEQEQERKPSAAGASVADDFDPVVRAVEGKGEKKLPLETATDPVEIITPDQTASFETPNGLHSIQYKYRPERRNSNGRQVPNGSPISEQINPSSEQKSRSDQGGTLTSKKTAKLPSYEACRLAALLKSEILRNKPDCRITPAKVRNWEVTADRMLRIDGRTPEQIAGLIRWVQSDEFWRANVLCMDTLRDKFDQLSMKAELKTRAGDKSAPVKLPPSYVSASEQILQERNARVRGAQ
jgi:hypothetical protein